MCRLFFKSLIATLVLVSCAPQHGPYGSSNQINKQQIGAIAGALGGGFLGKNVGKGKGKTLGTIAGALGGAFIGSQLGQSLDRADRGYFENITQASLEQTPAGTTSRWINPDTGNSGTVTPTRTYESSKGKYCREFTQTIEVGGERQEAYGTACRQGDGTWRVVNN